MKLQEYTLKDFLPTRFQAYKDRAKIKNKEFSLTFEEFKNLVLANCYYCDTPAESGLPYLFHKEKFRLHTIDRLDNSLGYVKSNVTTACAFCNHAKGDLSVSEFVSWIACAARISGNSINKAELGLRIHNVLHARFCRRKFGVKRWD
jgi:hypothetical protein